MAMSANETKFHEGVDTLLPGKAGVRPEGEMHRIAREGSAHAAAAKTGLDSLLDRLTPGKAGVRTEGDLLGMLRRTEFNTAATNAQVTALVGALKAVSSGDAFDEAKLLESIARVTRESFDAALKDAAPAEVTLTVEKEG